MNFGARECIRDSSSVLGLVVVSDKLRLLSCLSNLALDLELLISAFGFS